MKIKQIKLISPELYLVTYITRWLNRKVERYVIANPSKPVLGTSTHSFFFRDTGEVVLSNDGYFILKWMIRNDVDFLDNFPSKYEQLKDVMRDMNERQKPSLRAKIPVKTHDPYPNVDLVGNVPNIPHVPPMPYKRKIPNFRNYTPIPEKPQEVFTLNQWECREPRVFITPATTDQYDIDEAQKRVREITFKFAHQNGRRERDQDLQPIYKWAEKRSIATLNELIKSIPPLEPAS